MSFFNVFKTTNNVGYSIITLPFKLSRRLLLASSSLYLKNNTEVYLDFNTTRDIMYIWAAGREGFWQVTGFSDYIMFRVTIL